MVTWQKLPAIEELEEQWIAEQVKIGVPEAAVREVVKRFLELEPEWVKRYLEKW